jgi:histidyl-tRNA synthetase
MAQKIGPLSGFPEFLPSQRVVEREVIASLSRSFELHGFANIETRVVEPLDRLAKGGEIDKEIYVLRRLQAEDSGDDSGLGLHFDLTVPFARYTLEHAGHLEFPFRRFQIQPAWRGERPQEGRYRQFTQADVDIVGRDVLAFHHDIEVMRVMVEALDALPIPPVSFQFNNRKLIQGFYRGLGIADVTAAIRTIDKLDKLPAEEVARLLVDNAGATPEQAEKALELASIRVADTSLVERVRALGVDDELLDEGLGELAAVVEGCAAGGHTKVTVEANLRIARGLDYYTGTVVEIFMTGYERLKSVGGGGRTHEAGTCVPPTRPDRHPHRMGGQAARSRRRGVHRPARRQRRRPGRRARRGADRRRHTTCATNTACKVTGEVVARGGQRQPRPADRRDRGRRRASSRCSTRPSAPLPFQIDERVTVGEEARLKYRYLDLRRPGAQRAHAIRLRSKVNAAARERCSPEHDFVEIETPTLTRSTPEGARDFLVPARLRRAPGMPCRRARSCSSSCSWSPGWSATTRSPAATATRTSAPTGSRSSPSSTSR